MKVRLAVNSVTMGDYQRPLQISQFVKDVHAGFQVLNLKNDALRRRSDSIKYSVGAPTCGPASAHLTWYAGQEGGRRGLRLVAAGSHPQGQVAVLAARSRHGRSGNGAIDDGRALALTILRHGIRVIRASARCSSRGVGFSVARLMS